MHKTSAKARRAPERRYVNYFEVGHNVCEFVIDLGQFNFEIAQPLLSSRVVTGPAYAKLLARMLQESVERFEASYGAIREAGDELDPFEVVKQSIAGYDGAPDDDARVKPVKT
ncbi:DUF3467 domain-containing protein [Burkholderia ubonensis]|uniref:DUF3467 domain-containing protein n=1 Tax=Burkholderia ubonensis subsp. mesacidophila TaxID=265293 RepID=A0A2A4EV03_9BURK|nr:DUF3467 domain-containing protein [Burkholderia ubonensis]PCE24675.1 hypothetical protein BZL54_32525 [Burkholderia ubonensis subsp. mesacidophila]